MKLMDFKLEQEINSHYKASDFINHNITKPIIVSCTYGWNNPSLCVKSLANLEFMKLNIMWKIWNEINWKL